MSYVLFLRGYGLAEPEMIARLAQAAQLPPSDARIHLASRFPRSLAAYPDPDQAMEALVKMQEQRFECFLASTEEVDGPPSVARAAQAEFGDASVSWWHAKREGAASP